MHESIPRRHWRFVFLSFLLLMGFIVLVTVVMPLLFSPRTTKPWSAPYYKETDTLAADPMITGRVALSDRLGGPVTSPDDPTLGPDNARITITVFTDFTCWYCGETMRAVQAIQAALPDDVRVVHKDFPAADQTYVSYQTAIAGRCAQREQAFWPLGEKLYEHYDQLTRETISRIAGDLGLNQARFLECLDGKTKESVTDLIDANIAEGNALGISGIPVVYINDKAFVGQITAEELRTAIDTLLKQR